MGVKTKYPGVRKTQNGWMIDIRLKMPDGTIKRLRKSGFETQAKAAAAAGKLKAEALEGRYFDRELATFFTVRDAWELFEPFAEESHASIKTTKGRAKHLIVHLGDKQAINLTQSDVVRYRAARREEKTSRNSIPSDGTVNREISLLRRLLNYAVKCKRMRFNPLSGVELLKEDNVRNVDVPDEDVDSLMAAAEQPLRSFLFVARDSGMRKSSILRLRRSQIDVTGERAIIKLAKSDTKQNKAQTVVLTLRATQAIQELLNSHKSKWVFVNNATNKPYIDFRKMYRRAFKKADLEGKGYWLHDQRRKFTTEARRAGVDESTIMSMTGHKTRSAFERYNIVSTRDQESAVKKIEASTAEKTVDMKSWKTVKQLQAENQSLREEVEGLRDENLQLKRTLKILLDREEPSEEQVINQ